MKRHKQMLLLGTQNMFFFHKNSIYQAMAATYIPMDKTYFFITL